MRAYRVSRTIKLWASTGNDFETAISRWPAARRRDRVVALRIPGRARTLLDLDFLAQPDLNNCSERFAFGAYFRHQFLPFGIGLQLRHILPVGFPAAGFRDRRDRREIGA